MTPCLLSKSAMKCKCMNTLYLIRQELTFATQYSKMSLYLLGLKGGYDVRHGNILHSRGGSKGTAHLNRDGETLYQAQGADRYRRWGGLPHSCGRVQAICREAQYQQTRGKQINTLALPVAPRLSSISFQPVDDNPCMMLPVVNCRTIGEVVSSLS